MISSGSICLRGGRIIDPGSGTDADGDLLILDGRVERCGHVGAVPDGVSVINAAGQVVCPGFVDLHTHLRFPGSPEKETVASGTAAAAAGGFTTVCAMANTDPVVDSVGALRMVLGQARSEARVRVRQLASLSHGLRGERITDMSALTEAGAVAFSDDGKPVWNGDLMARALVESARLDRAISVHEEDPALVAGGMANAGSVAARLGLAPWPCSGEASMVARDVEILARTGGRLHIAHVSCADTIPILRDAQRRGLPVTAEVTPHHLRMADQLLEGDADLGLPPAHPCTKVNPPLRSPMDVEAMVEALADGTIDAVATDHAPHTRADKEGAFAAAAFGFSGIETALPLLLDLVRSGALPLTALVHRLTLGPATVFGLDAGTLRPGVPGDVCVFDPDLEWTVYPEALQSRGKNTPLLGAAMRGRVTHTIVSGTVVHRLDC